MRRRKRFVGESGELVQQSSVICVKKPKSSSLPYETLPKPKHYSHSPFWGAGNTNTPIDLLLYLGIPWQIGQLGKEEVEWLSFREAFLADAARPM
jgi:hypothetical protein